MHFLPFRLRVVPRTLVFKQPAGTSRGVYLQRKVWYVVITSADSALRFTGLGECAPLHDLSCDYDADYEQRLRSICAEVEQTQNFDTEALRHQPSILFGLQTAFRSAAGSLRGDYRRLFESDFVHGRRGIRINGLVWMGTFEEMAARMEAKLSEGFTCVKLKIGAIDFESELELIRRLRQRFSAADVELRVDANGGFTPDEAPRRLEQLSHFGIHSIEQPIRAGQWEQLSRLCAETPIPIALDEELIGVNDTARKQELLDAVRPQFIVLKPSLHGAFTGAAEWMNLARERGIGYWTTSALESNVGLNAIAQWCAAIDPDTTLPQGLGTGRLFVQNVDNIPLSVEGERLWYGNEKQRTFEREADEFQAEWLSEDPFVEVHTSGSTGEPKPMEASKIGMYHSAMASAGALGLCEGNTALVAMPLRYIAGKMMLVRSFVTPLQPILVAPTSHPYATLHEAPDFAALTPMQVYESLRVPHERSLLRRTLCLIIGGGKIPEALERELQSFPNPVWSTYGMTETLSHIALRRINGPQASQAYTPLQGVSVSLSADGTLVIDAPAVCAERLTTNDVAEIHADGSFTILGRRDNVVCSGGIKLQIEQIEQQLEPLGRQLQVTAVSDERLGEAVALLYVGTPAEAGPLEARCRTLLEAYAVPRHYFAVESLPLTPTGKPARAEARRLAQEMLGGRHN